MTPAWYSPIRVGQKFHFNRVLGDPYKDFSRDIKESDEEYQMLGKQEQSLHFSSLHNSYMKVLLFGSTEAEFSNLSVKYAQSL